MNQRQRFNRAVYATPALRKILEIPRRVWTDADAQRLIDEWAPTLLTPKGKQELARLNLLAPKERAAELERLGRKGYPLVPSLDQIKILADFVQCGGRHLALATVGTGKTWILFMSAVLSETYFQTQRPTVVIPAYLWDDTLASHQKFAEFWTPPKQPIRVITYNDISSVRNAFLLCTCASCTNGADLKDVFADIKDPPTPIKPDFLGFDEVDALRHVTKSAVARRVARFFANHSSRECKRIGVTGTLVEDSVGEMFHMLTWFLEENAPVPLEYTEREAWCAAMDRTGPRTGRYDPSVLIQAFGGDLSAEDWHKEARRAYGRFLSQTPGFVVVNKSSCDTPVYMRVVTAPRDEAIENLFVPLRDHGQAVDEYIIGDSLSRRRYAVTLGSGWVDVWDPRPPKQWLDARNAYNQAISDAIKNSARRGVPVDTEWHARRLIRGTKEWNEWRQIEPTFEPNTVPVSVSLSAVNYVKQWLELNSPAVVWVTGTWLGKTLEDVTRTLYYASDGKSRGGSTPVPGRSIIASVDANKRGRNWYDWNKCLVVGAIASASLIEQIVGRMHRQGQKDPVWVDYLAVSGESIRAFDTVRERSSMAEDLFEIRQKVITAEWDTSLLTQEYLDPDDAGLGEGFAARWRRPAVKESEDE